MIVEETHYYSFMNRIIIVVIFLIAVLIGAYFFYKRNIIKYELVYEIPDSKEEFRPHAYVFFHSDKDLQRYFRINSATTEIGKKRIVSNLILKNIHIVFFLARE